MYLNLGVQQFLAHPQKPTYWVSHNVIWFGLYYNIGANQFLLHSISLAEHTVTKHVCRPFYLAAVENMVLLIYTIVYYEIMNCV